jgi:serine/threonine-protein kinase
MRTLAWVDRNGRQEPLPIEPGAYEDPMVSPDGTRIALAMVREADARDIWIWQMARQTLSRLTFDTTSEIAPLWTRDGARIVYSSNGLFSRAADGTGAAERVGTPGGAAFGWGADGRLVTGTPGRGDIGVVEPDGQRRPLVATTTFSESAPAMSPDGRWMAYESDESGQIEIYVRPYPDVEKGKWLISSGGGIRPRWSPTGTEVFFIGSDRMMAVRVDTRSGFTYERPMPLFATQPYAILARPRSYDVSADGKRLLMLVEAGGAEGTEERADLVLIQNWRPPLPK